MDDGFAVKGGARRSRPWLEAGGMALLAVLVVAAAWLCCPTPLIGDPIQTELLSVQVAKDGQVFRWRPRSVAERQIARAIVDHLATVEKRITLHWARPALAERAEVVLYVRTEDCYQTVALGKTAGLVWDQDRLGLAAQVLRPQALADYLRGQLDGGLLWTTGAA